MYSDLKQRRKEEEKRWKRSEMSRWLGEWRDGERRGRGGKPKKEEFWNIQIKSTSREKQKQVCRAYQKSSWKAKLEKKGRPITTLFSKIRNILPTQEWFTCHALHLKQNNSSQASQNPFFCRPLLFFISKKIFKNCLLKHPRTAWGIQGGKRRAQAARPARTGPLPKRP